MRALLEREYRPLFVALALCFAYHGALLLSGTFKGTYDAYVHIFFADHYARAWFDHWEPRWYTGFPMVGYPPGSHYSVALLSFALGLETSFVIVFLFSLLNCTVGIYRFSKIWVSSEAAGTASLLFVFASCVAETVHVFGQLPTMFSLGFLLNTVPFVYQWMREGRVRILLTAWLMNAATTAGHHVTTLFGAVFFIAPVMVLALVEAMREPLPDEPPGHPGRVTLHNIKPLVMRRFRRMFPALLRALVYGPGLIVVLIFVVMPYWIWSKSDPITQVSIPHASRDSFIENTAAGLVFWLIPYGLSAITIPYVLYKGFSGRMWPMAASYALLVLLGTGGTTPIPRFLLRGAFDILTLDRFTFWATITQLPVLGEFVLSLRKGRLARYTREQFGDLTWRLVQMGLLVVYMGLSGFFSNFTKYRTFQPDPIDFKPIVTFLEKDQHWRWRYLTLGFGDQMAWLAAQTTACSVDGNYHSARRLPELTSTPVERLEGAKYSGIPGIGSLQQFLAVPEKYSLKFVFSNDQFYDPLLFFSGWHRLQRLENGIMVWERADIPPMPEVLPRKEIPVYQRVMWGTVPMTALFAGLTAFSAPFWKPYLLWLFHVEEGGITTPFDFRRKFWRVATLPLRRIWKVLQFLARQARPRERARAWFQRLDQKLLAASVVPPGELEESGSWQPWKEWVRRLPRPRPASPTAHAVRLALLVVLSAVAVTVVIVRHMNRARSPKKVVEAYFDDLDFRRFSKAHARLDPETRPPFDQYLLELSVKGGIVASYGKLDSVRVRVLSEFDDRVDLRANTTWVTSITAYEAFDRMTLHRRGDEWVIEPEPVDISSPQDQFFRRGEVGWVQQGRRRVSTGTTNFSDVLDRPQLQLLSARLVLWGELYSVVGELINVDSDPADVTVSSVLKDSFDNQLSRYNAQTGMIHKILPKEITPFRVDFEGVAGTNIDQSFKVEKFDPKSFTAPQLESPVVSFETYAKAVVTQHDLQRDLAVQDVRIKEEEGGFVLYGELFNMGTGEATIPHVFLTYYDEDNQVAWVDHFYIRDSIRSLRSTKVRLELADAKDLSTVLVSGDLFTNNLSATFEPGDDWEERIPLPARSGFSALRVNSHAFRGAPK